MGATALREARPDDTLRGWQALDTVRHRLFARETRETRLGRYVLGQRLAAGGAGIVFTGTDPELDRPVAIKLLREGPDGRPLDSRGRERLLREARSLAKVSHPNVIQIYDVGELDGALTTKLAGENPEGNERPERSVFIVMELVAGETLADVLRKRRLSWREISRLFLDAGRGLAAAHAAGLVHRDFKPANVLVGVDGRVRVLDFGLARGASDESGSTGPVNRDKTVPSQTRYATPALTQAGTVLGTPAYMAPEQHEGRVTDARSDQYSFCASLFEGLYRRRPFAALSLHALARKKKEGIRVPRLPGVPLWLRRLLVRGLAPEPDDRWPSMSHLLRELGAGSRPRGVRWWLAAATAFAASALLPGYSPRASEGRCDPSPLSGTWSDATQRDVERALLATSSAYAGQTWTRVADGLDAYASDWTRAYEQACSAANDQDRRSVDRTMACLLDRRAELGGLVSVLSEADAGVLERAVTAVSSLSPVDSCTNPTRLQDGVEPPPTRQVSAVAALREQLAYLRAIGTAGRYVRAQQLAPPLLEQARALGYIPVVVEALREVADIEQSQGEIDDAVEYLVEAYWLATDRGYDRLAANTSANLLSTLAYRGGDLNQAATWARHATSALERSGGEGTLAEGRLEHGLSYLAARQGDTAASVVHARRSLRIFEQLYGPDHALVGELQNHIGGALIMRGDSAAGLVHLQKSVNILARVLGPIHPRTASARINLGIALWWLGRTEDARRHLEQALVDLDRDRGSSHPWIANCLNALGDLALQEGSPTKAMSYFRRALAANERTVGLEHPDTAVSLRNIAQALQHQGDYDRALEMFERARSLRERTLGPNHLMLADSIHDLAALAVDMHQYELARAHFERALAIITESVGTYHPYVAQTLTALGDTLMQLGLIDEARHCLERGLVVAEAESYGPQLADTRFTLARAIGDSPRAIGLARAARDGYAKAGDMYDSDLATVDTWLRNAGPSG